MRKYRRRSNEEIQEANVNLTPLIDVVFVVLISFILIAPFLQIDSIYLASGNPVKGSETPKSAHLTLTIHGDNTIGCNGKKIRFEELHEILYKEKKAHPLSIPQVIPDSRCHFEMYQRVKNALENAGFSQMDILLKNS